MEDGGDTLGSEGGGAAEWQQRSLRGGNNSKLVGKAGWTCSRAVVVAMRLSGAA